MYASLVLFLEKKASVGTNYGYGMQDDPGF